MGCPMLYRAVVSGKKSQISTPSLITTNVITKGVPLVTPILIGWVRIYIHRLVYCDTLDTFLYRVSTRVSRYFCCIDSCIDSARNLGYRTALLCLNHPESLWKRKMSRSSPMSGCLVGSSGSSLLLSRFFGWGGEDDVTRHLEAAGYKIAANDNVTGW